MKSQALERFLEDNSQKGISGKVFYDEKGPFKRTPRILSEFVEAIVSNGRGYSSDNDFPHKFINWQDEIKEGYPDYNKVYYN